MSRPKLKVPFESIDIVVELISISLLLLMGCYVAMELSHLPETVPTHFNAKGEADDYGSKFSLISLPLIALVLYLFLFIINKFPHLHNYSVNITEDNALKQYRTSTRFVRFLNLFTTLIFAYITYAIVESAKGPIKELGSWFLPVIIGFTIIVPIGLFLYMKRLNN